MTERELKKIFTPEVIEYYQNNKDEITSELLQELRNTNAGKEMANKLLQIPKNEEGYYLDAFQKEISYRKIPTLKNINRKLPLHNIHKSEIKKCSEDIYYFMNNYVKIKTKNGIDYPEIRPYQKEFLDVIIKDENESIVGLLPRQCCCNTTMVNITNNNIMKTQTFKELFNECKSEHYRKA